jgi:hypothetical protein
MASALQTIRAAGLTAELTGSGGLLVRQASQITDDLRALIRANRDDLVSFLTREAANDDPVLIDLLAAAMQVCDHHGDGEQARDQMRQDIRQTPPHLRADLLAHFRGAYGL